MTRIINALIVAVFIASPIVSLPGIGECETIPDSKLSASDQAITESRAVSMVEFESFARPHRNAILGRDFAFIFGALAYGTRSSNDGGASMSMAVSAGFCFLFSVFMENRSSHALNLMMAKTEK